MIRTDCDIFHFESCDHLNAVDISRLQLCGDL